ncbi:PfkB family carbohydrate kinase [Micromonospora sp. WMMA1363]|uniref:PfkB family carbohydrate kinase n=1 Tax=Micromonospora sp. WMMA1363 TaxID=3053985 RepID=UPI00259C8DDC|nr:PfkB family carbohydrate kinase [Micromonospora sp. WMMA1363]MDM4719825.1 PfkB family carbohydrate kinase [Micromonospora sp. WMMA1363]
MGYAVVLGEALVDLLDAECAGEPVYRQTIGGGPLNVAVGVARLGGEVQFVGSLGDDALANRIRDFLTRVGVGLAGAVTVSAPTALAVSTHTAPEPDFRCYGEPRSYALLAADELDADLIAGADVLYCGSLLLLHPATLAAVRRAWSASTGLRVFDHDVPPRMLGGAPAPNSLRAVVAEFAAGAHLVKLSGVNAGQLYRGEPIEGVAAHLRELGAGAVVITLGADGAVVAVAGGDPVRVPAPKVDAVDATGAGDAVTAALVADLLTDGEPVEPAGWHERVAFALRVAGLVCESPGSATAMPTRAEVVRRFAG